MADTAVTFLLENLAQLASDQLNLIANAKNELEGLETDLREMKTFLEDASEKPNKDERFKMYERQIREVCYEVEDTIDLCISTPNYNPKNLTLQREVRNLREKKVKPVFDRVTEFAYLRSTLSDSTILPTKTMRLKVPRQDNVVGLEKQTDTLIERLNENSNELDVLSIIGMPGLGKTTLAWKVYRDSRIQYEFPTIVWIFFSQDYNMKDVLLTILKKFTQQDMSSKSIDELAELVNENLKRGKFLIFFDDVWTVEAWNQIRNFLPKDNKMGKVLITTRHKKVACHANLSRDPHQLEFLTKEKSFELLHLEVFGRGPEFPEDLIPYGRIIAEKCGGLPLAIVVIGGILVDTYSTPGDARSEWRKISEDVNKYLHQGEEGKHMDKIISWSYRTMPYELKDCFLYLGMFPEDTEIPVWKLNQLWIAEGFIKKKPGKSLEETAKDNLNDLISRNLVMAEKTKLNGDVKTCLIHDTIREFCQKKACHEEQNLFQEIRKSKDTGNFEPSDQVIQKCRRLCINSYVHDFFLKKLKIPKTRSFLCNSKETINIQTKDISSITDVLTIVRVLDANTIKFPRFPVKITKLVHLKYLTLSCDDLKILPEPLSKLWNMQTLTVDTSERTLEIKASIWEMMQLRHVKTKASMILKKSGKGKGGANLQTLDRLSPQSCTVDVFNKAKNLKTLGIRGDLTTILDSNCLEKLQLLEKLKLMNDVFPKVASENPLPKFPQRFPPKIKVLTLSSTYLDWSHMSAVGKLGTLEVLKLKDNAFVGNFWEVSPGDVFHKLELLYIARTDIKVWTVTSSDSSFPKLKSIVIKTCEKLDEVPTNLVEKLEMLSMERVTKYAVTSARKIEKKKREAEGHQMVNKSRFKLIIAPGDE